MRTVDPVSQVSLCVSKQKFFLNTTVLSAHPWGWPAVSGPWCPEHLWCFPEWSSCNHPPRSRWSLSDCPGCRRLAGPCQPGWDSARKKQRGRKRERGRWSESTMLLLKQWNQFNGSDTQTHSISQQVQMWQQELKIHLALKNWRERSWGGQPPFTVAGNQRDH